MKSSILIAFVLGLCVAISHAGHGHQGYFQYANVPGWGQYEFGYHRGNPSHYTSRYEQGHGWRARTKVRWGDKKGGYGEHYFDYNHHDKGHKDKGHKGWGWEGHSSHGHGHQGHGHGHGHHGGHYGSFSENVPQVVPKITNNNLQNHRMPGERPRI